MLKKISILILLAAAVFAYAENPLGGQPNKKLIRFGWEDITASSLLQKVKIFEERSPFDGVGILLQGKIPDSKTVVTPRFIFDTKNPWQYEWFQDDVEKLKKVKFTKFTDNFLYASSRPGGADWFDDEAWAVVVNNFRIMARIARETGCKGITFDPEHYAANSKTQFDYSPLTGHSWDETWEKACQRGREVASAISAEYPECKFMGFFWLSYAYDGAMSRNPYEAMAHHAKGLYVAFINGMYDNCGAMSFVDGYEEHGYLSKIPEDYQQIVYRYQKILPKLLTPENRLKYHAKTSLAIAVYLDGYFITPNTTHWNMMPGVPLENVEERFALLTRNMKLAFEAADEYVWIWEERGSFWPRYNMTVHNYKVKLWEQHVPGITEMFRTVKDPRPAAAVRVARKRNTTWFATATLKISTRIGISRRQTDISP